MGEETRDRNAVFSKSIYLYGMGGTLVYGLWGLSMGFHFLLLEEALLSVIFLICHISARSGHSRIAITLGILTIIYTGVRFCLLFGWSSDTYIFILALIPLITIAEKVPVLLKKILVPLIFILTFTLWGLLRNRAPLIILAPPWDSLLSLINLTVALGVITLSFFFYGKTFLRTEQEMEVAHNIMTDRANRDSLTGTYNRRFMERHLAETLGMKDGADCPAVVALLDIDDFKAINDTYGHSDGDRVLKSLVRRLSDNLREEDHIGRWGGEEFLIVLRKCHHDKGLEIIERLRTLISGTPFEISGDRRIQVTATLGVAGDAGDRRSWEEVVAEADRYLYMGKKAGKNRVVSASGEGTGK